MRVHHKVQNLQLLEVLNLMVDPTQSWNLQWHTFKSHCGAASAGPEVSAGRDTAQPADKGHLNDLVHLPEPPALQQEPDQTLLFWF